MSVHFLQSDAVYIPLRSETVDMIVTSPPYYNAREYSQWESYPGYHTNMLSVLHECYRVLKVGGRIAVNVPQGYGRPGNGGYITIGDDWCENILLAGFEMRGHVIWNKGNLSPQANGTAWGSWMSASNPALRDCHELILVAHKDEARILVDGVSTIDRDTFLTSTMSVWNIPPVPSHWHPAPFPTEIPRRLIELYTYRGNVVLDPFSGSGTTAMVADRLGRVGIGMDLSREYLVKSRLITAINGGEWELARQLNVKKGKSSDIGDLPMFKKGV
jgi:site-specific DNA-methyltransferase (adenine-specific)